ncbi:zinc ABC transporter substrate-binding protein [Glutamicibacter mishrai]|uniref:metal ABC transporter solute-binding protein, Zn/Mn family n=1 Tax=Glutamicibacter mishrai TaxID=1775880 RepID=UPI0020CE3B96|nr:zinc ABC transporter substrate-binding protein [Glutamicibacter mishrai]UTT38999.1 zinc ABC transporter substrate-binding protein [Glutamicibacter mishrai]
MKKYRSLLAMAVAVPAAGMILAGCASTGSEASEGDTSAVKVVATTNVYGQVARAVGGDNVSVSEIITSAAQDPHSYEPTTRDKLTVSEANVVLANGGGYDQFMDSLVQSLPSDQASNVQLIHAVDTSPIAKEPEEEEAHEGESAEEHAEHADEESHEGHDHAGYNEHIWYDLDSMSALADELADTFGKADAANAQQYTKNADEFNAGIKQLQTQLSDAKLEGKKFVMTEPVPFHLLDDAGMENTTPEGLSEAIEEGEGIAPMTLKKAQDLLVNGKSDILAYNVQTEGNETKALKKNAESGKVPVVDFSETIQDDSSYLDWMNSNISNLASAING